MKNENSNNFTRKQSLNKQKLDKEEKKSNEDHDLVNQIEINLKPKGEEQLKNIQDNDKQGKLKKPEKRVYATRTKKKAEIQEKPINVIEQEISDRQISVKERLSHFNSKRPPKIETNETINLLSPERKTVNQLVTENENRIRGLSKSPVNQNDSNSIIKLKNEFNVTNSYSELLSFFNTLIEKNKNNKNENERKIAEQILKDMNIEQFDQIKQMKNYFQREMNLKTGSQIDVFSDSSFNGRSHGNSLTEIRNNHLFPNKSKFKNERSDYSGSNQSINSFEKNDNLSKCFYDFDDQNKEAMSLNFSQIEKNETKSKTGKNIELNNKDNNNKIQSDISLSSITIIDPLKENKLLIGNFEDLTPKERNTDFIENNFGNQIEKVKSNKKNKNNLEINTKNDDTQEGNNNFYFEEEKLMKENLVKVPNLKISSTEINLSECNPKFIIQKFNERMKSPRNSEQEVPSQENKEIILKNQIIESSDKDDKNVKTENNKYKQNIIKTLNEISVAQYEISKDLPLDSWFYDILCINCYECVKIENVDEHSKNCVIKNDDDYNEIMENDLIDEDINAKIYKIFLNLKSNENTFDNSNCKELIEIFKEFVKIVYEIFLNNNSVSDFDDSIKKLDDLIKNKVKTGNDSNLKFFIFINSRRISQLALLKLNEILHTQITNKIIENQYSNSLDSSFNNSVDKENEIQYKQLKNELTTLEMKALESKKELENWKKQAKKLEKKLKKPNNNKIVVSEINSEVNSFRDNSKLDQLTNITGQTDNSQDIGNIKEVNEVIKTKTEEEKRRYFYNILFSIKFKYQGKIKDAILADEIYDWVKKSNKPLNEWSSIIINKLGIKEEVI